MSESAWDVTYSLLVDDYQGPKRVITVDAPGSKEARERAFELLLEQEAAWLRSGGDISIRGVAAHLAS